MRFRQIDEGFDYVFKGDTIDEQVKRLKLLASRSQCYVPLVRMGVGAEDTEWGVPDGMPNTIKIQEDIPVGMGETTIQIEWRRIRAFTDPNSNMRKLPPWKQEMQWLGLLESLKANEAHLLTAVKDKRLLTMYPKLEALMEPLGITDYVKPVPAKKKRTPRKKKD